MEDLLDRGWRPKKIEMLWTSLEKREFPVSPGMAERRQKHHHLDNGSSSLHPGTFNSLQQFSSLAHAMIHYVKRNLNVSSLKDEQKEAAVHLLQSKDIVAILPTGLEESLIYQLYANGVNVVVLVKSIMKEQIKDMEKLWIPSIVWSTKDDVLLMTGVQNTTLFLEYSGRLMGCKIPKHVIEQMIHAHCS